MDLMWDHILEKLCNRTEWLAPNYYRNYFTK
jgi:hypothetical protein